MDKQFKVIIMFRKNVVGDRYVYDEPFLVTSSYGNYVVAMGHHQGEDIVMRNCFEIEKLSSKIHKNAPFTVKFPYPPRLLSSHLRDRSFDPTNIGIILDESIEREVYEKLKTEYRTEPSKDDFLVHLVGFAECFGRSIEHIKNTGKGFEISFRSVVDDIKNANKDVVSLTLLPKTHPMALEATERISKKVTKNSASFEKSFKKAEVPEIKDSKVVSKVSINTIDVAKIKEELRKKIIGQDDAIDKIVNNIFFNQKYIDMRNPDLLRQKANIILDGPTGSGKTFILEEVAKFLHLPIVIASATNYSTVGYRGSDLSEILEKLLRQTNGDLELAERGIVVLDEFDKLGSREADEELAMRRAVQQELLTFISGTKIMVSFNGKTYDFDTSRLTIIGMGAFQKLREEKIRENEKKYSPPIGFGVSHDSDHERVYSITKEDYIKEGLEREMVGRFSCLAHTNELSVDDLKRILLKSSASPLIQIRALGIIMNCKITIDGSIIDELAQMAYDTNVGARGLIQIVQSLKDVVSNEILSGKGEVVITREHLEKSKLNHLRTYYERVNVGR